MTTTEKNVPLTPMDHCVPRAYFHAALYLPLKTGVTPAQAFDLLHEGLGRTFARLPWLNGQVHFQSPKSPGWRPGQLELRYKATSKDGPRPVQLKYKELETDLDYATLRELGFPLDSFPDADIAPCSFFADLNAGPDVFAGQANFVPGGCILVASIHHVASDETAFFHFLRLWANHCAALQTHCPPPADLPVDSDNRNILREIWSHEAPVSSVKEIDPETWRLIGLLPTDVQKDPSEEVPAPSPPPPFSRPPLKAGVFYISPTRLRDLREATARETGAPSNISTNDVVCALIWRCLLRARVLARRAPSIGAGETGNEAAKSGLNMVCDGRSNYSPALPETYLGNITFNLQSSLPLDTLISSDSTLGTVAAVLRRNAERIGSADVLNLYNLLAHMPSYDDLPRLKRMRTPTLDGNDLSISSLINVPMDSVCFGDGPVFRNRGFVESARLLMDATNTFTRTCVILPRSKNGSVEFLANMYDEDMEVLAADKEFGQYVLCLCWPESVK